MHFSTVLYHEIRKEKNFNPDQPAHIDVNQNYRLSEYCGHIEPAVRNFEPPFAATCVAIFLQQSTRKLALAVTVFTNRKMSTLLK